MEKVKMGIIFEGERIIFRREIEIGSQKLGAVQEISDPYLQNALKTIADSLNSHMLEYMKGLGGKSAQTYK